MGSHELEFNAACCRLNTLACYQELDEGDEDVDENQLKQENGLITRIRESGAV